MASFQGNAQMPRITIQVRIKPESKQVLNDSLAMVQRMQDLSPVLRRVPAEVLIPSILETFSAGGRPAWRFKGYQSDPPMVKSGLMKRGLTQLGGGLNKVTVTKDTVSFELDPTPFIAARRAAEPGASYDYFYPEAHQYGTKKHYKNIVLNIQDKDIEKLEAMFADYIAGGSSDRNSKSSK